VSSIIYFLSCLFALRNTRLRPSLKVYLYTAQLTNMSENPEEEIQGESDHHV